MPNARPSTFVSPPTGLTTRDLPPASEGLRAPAGVTGRPDKRHRQRHPGTPGRMSDPDRDSFVDTVMALADKLPPIDIARATGTSTSGRAVREVIKSARTALQARAEFYVEAHAMATIAAAAEGNSKPAEWALTHIAEGEDRVVDPEKKETTQVAPTFNLGFVLGGVPVALAPVPAPSAVIDIKPEPSR